MTERDISARLTALGLAATAAGLDDIVAMATKKRWSPVQLLEHVLSLEEQDRSRRGLDRRLKRSRLERFKPMADFDWNWPTKIDRSLVESALRLDFIEDARNIVLVAPQGLGKTMMAQNIVHQAATPTLADALSQAEDQVKSLSADIQSMEAAKDHATTPRLDHRPHRQARHLLATRTEKSALALRRLTGAITLSPQKPKVARP
jgi:DNA replication protein DnaC